MNPLLKIGLLLAIGVGLVGSAFAQDKVPEKPRGALVSGADLEKLIGAAVILEMNNTFNGTWNSIALGRSGWAFNQYVSNRSTGGQDEGVWKIKGDTLCWAFKGSHMAEACRRHYKGGDNAYEVWSADDAYFVGTYRVRRPE